MRLGTLADFTLDISEEDISLLTASILNPSGLAVSCLLKRQPDSHIGERQGTDNDILDRLTERVTAGLMLRMDAVVMPSGPSEWNPGSLKLSQSE